MRQLTLFLISFISCLSLTASNDDDVVLKELIVIVKEHQTTTDVDRTIGFEPNAYLLRDMNLLEINNACSSTIFIVNSSNQIVDQFSVSGFNSVEYLPAPTTAGVYTLVIWSDTYYGEGVFTVN